MNHTQATLPTPSDSTRQGTALDAIRQEATEATGEENGSLRIAAFPSVFATVLPPILRRFRSLHPGIEVVLLETDDREVERWLEAGSIDLGVVLNPPPESDAVPIGQDAWVGVLPAGHRFARRTTLSLAELVAEPFVLATGGCHAHAGTLADAAKLSLGDVRKGLRVARIDPPLCRRFGLMASTGQEPSHAANLFMVCVRQANL